jgi:bacterioferritin-associated ferredoxin
MTIENQDAPDEVICACSGTTRADVARLFKEGLDADGISRRTGAISGCGGCEWDITEILKTLTETPKT